MKITFIFSCSGMLRNVPACSGMFRVSGFIDAHLAMTYSYLLTYSLPRFLRVTSLCLHVPVIPTGA